MYCSSFYRVVCKEALRNYNSLSNPAADAPEEQLNELEEVFKKAAKTDTPAEVQNCLIQICLVALTGPIIQFIYFQVPDHLCCKITLDIFRDPVITPSGVTYERAVLLDHLQTVTDTSVGILCVCVCLQCTSVLTF